MLLLVITRILAAEAASYGVIAAFIGVSAVIVSIASIVSTAAIVSIISQEAPSGSMVLLVITRILAAEAASYGGIAAFIGVNSLIATIATIATTATNATTAAIVSIIS